MGSKQIILAIDNAPVWSNQRSPTTSNQKPSNKCNVAKRWKRKTRETKTIKICSNLSRYRNWTLVSIPEKIPIFQHVFSSLFDVSSTSFSRWFPFTCWFSFWWRWIWLFWTYESSWLNPESSHVVIFYIYNGAVLIHCRHIPMTFQPKTIQKSMPATTS